VKWEHLKAFLWLRWRLVANRNRRAGKASVILQGILTALMLTGIAGSFVTGIAVGYAALPKTSTGGVMLTWDGVIIGFLFFWMIELLIELQRSELLSLDKFLHLPVSLSSAFLINYIGSLTSFGLLLLFPLMVGLAIGLVFSKGIVMLVLFPLIVAFGMAVTALTYQFRGWLASLMVNQRRRRTVITVTTFVVILIFQAPNLIGIVGGRWNRRPGTSQNATVQKQIEELDRRLSEKKIAPGDYRTSVRILRGPEREQSWIEFVATATTVNQIVPLGWLPYGAAAAFEGRALPALLGILGLGAIGVVSLRRSYVTTLRLYTGHFSASAPTAPARQTPAPTRAVVSGKYPAAFLEKKISRLSEHASAITVASFRSLMRAPEAKMMFLSPIIMIIIFGGMLFRQPSNPPELIRPLMVTGGCAFMMFMLIGMIGNLFGFDRSGFRVFVLSPVQRKDILLGKNLALAPFGIGFMFIAATAIQLVFPMRVDHYLAALVQMIPIYLIYCMVGNILSIIAPMAMSAGSLKPVKPKALFILIQIGFFFLFPIALAPTLLPLGVEFMLSWSGYSWVPAYLVFTVVECGLVIWLYS